MKFANADVTKEQVKGTLAMLRYYRAFLASESGRCRDLQSGWHRDSLDRAQARERLGSLVNVAINRKAGLPEGKIESEFWKECQIVQYITHKTNPGALQFWYSNKRQFKSRVLQRRYGARLAAFTAERNERWD